MGRLNKDIQGVFTNVVGSSNSIPTYNQFINRSTQGSHPGYCLADYVNEYRNKVNQHKLAIEQLAHLEVIIIQIRALSNLAGNVKLYTVRDTYIYGRCPFHRNESDINEVRVLIDLIELHFPTEKADLRKLSGNKDFMSKVYDKMSIVMCAEINANINDYKKIYSENICDIPNL
jgi:hypothetical protein